MSTTLDAYNKIVSGTHFLYNNINKVVMRTAVVKPHWQLMSYTNTSQQSKDTGNVFCFSNRYFFGTANYLKYRAQPVT